jgi:DNA-binding MarR family transcriptional regulator
MEAVGNTRLDGTDSDAGDVSANGGAFLLEAFLPHTLAVTAAHASRLFARRYAAAVGLNIAEWCVLAVVGQFGPIVPGAVVERTELDKMKVSRASATLVAANLLEQGPAPHDGRSRLLHLSRKGRIVYDASRSFALALEAQLAAGLSEHEWAMLRHCLHRLHEHVRTLEDSSAPAAATAAPRRPGLRVTERSRGSSGRPPAMAAAWTAA